MPFCTSDVDLDEEVALQMVVCCCGSARHSVVGQDDDAVVTGANAYLVLGTDHAVGLYSTQLALLDGKLLIAVVEFCAKRGNNHLLACGYVGSTANDLFGFALAEIYRTNMHVVAVGMGLAGENLTNDDAFQTTFDALNFLHPIDFQAYACQGCGNFLCRHVEVNILVKPLIRDIHI